MTEELKQDNDWIDDAIKVIDFLYGDMASDLKEYLRGLRKEVVKGAIEKGENGVFDRGQNEKLS